MDHVQAGQMIGPYRIIEQIGQGGMATVYKAYHAAMDRYVAVKILPRQLAESPEFTGRFRQEARSRAKGGSASSSCQASCASAVMPVVERQDYRSTSPARNRGQSPIFGFIGHSQ